MPAWAGDLLFLLGLAVAITGVALIDVRAAMILGGLAVASLALLAHRPRGA